MPRLAIHRDAADDLQGIKGRGESADHGVLLAFLQQAKADPALLETLAEDWFGEDRTEPYSVRKVISMHRSGKRLWRVKVLDVKGLAVGYRVLYTFDPGSELIYVLGVVPRGIAYDQTNPRIQRLVAVYDSLGLA